MHVGFIPEENNLYEALRWGSIDCDSYGRDCYGGLQDAEKTFFYQHRAGKMSPF